MGRRFKMKMVADNDPRLTGKATQSGHQTVGGAGTVSVTLNTEASSATYVPSGYVLKKTTGISPAIPVIPDDTDMTDSRTTTGFDMQVFEAGELYWFIA